MDSLGWGGCIGIFVLSCYIKICSGVAGAGLGIQAAAKALSLDFIPVTKERYDLVIPTDHIEDEKIQCMLEIIRSDEFKQRVLAMGGYEVNETGRIVS